MLAPFFWALVIAYVVNIVIRNFENKLKLSRKYSLPLSFIVVLTILILFFVVLIPMLIDAIPSFVSDTSNLANNFNEWYNDNITNKIGSFSNETNNEIIKTNVEKLLKFMIGLLQSILSNIGSLVYSITTLIIEFLVGLVVAVYVLSDKENFFLKTRKLFTAYFGEKFTNKAAEILYISDEIFDNYLVAKSLDSLIVCIIALIGFKLIGLEYSFLFAIIIGVTNMVPYFGPIIGVVPVILITVFISPTQALWAIIFILILQQIDGNIIGPKIVDGKVGLPALWGVVSVTIGGTLFGFLGMLFGTPVFAIIRKIVLDIQDKKLAQ
ncbi:AI-2E family transporter, partial [Oceanivirga salmonicida]|uniref:AI-2E family transporter n=1 Tax=Oceanivirga salmonicida TaxID=1769291 RepID=UPI0012E15FF7